MRAKQIDRILSGQEPPDGVTGFLAALVQDLRDASRDEVPSSVAARHLLKMRLAMEASDGGPEPLIESEEAPLRPAPPVERSRPRVAALGLAAALVLGVGMAAAVTVPQLSGTRTGGPLRSDLESRAPGSIGFVPFIAGDAPTPALRGCTAAETLSALGISVANEVAPVVSPWPPACPVSSRPVQPPSGTIGTLGGGSTAQPLAAVLTTGVSTGTNGTSGSPQASSGQAKRGSGGGGNTGSGTAPNPGTGPGSGTDTGSGGGNTGGTTDPRTGRDPGGPQAEGSGNGGGKGRGHDHGRGPQATSDKPKATGKKSKP